LSGLPDLPAAKLIAVIAPRTKRAMMQHVTAGAADENIENDCRTDRPHRWVVSSLRGTAASAEPVREWVPVAEPLVGGDAAATQNKLTLGNRVGGAVPIDCRHTVALAQIGPVLKHLGGCSSPAQPMLPRQPTRERPATQTQNSVTLDHDNWQIFSC
jgi:hypothetical protein